MAAVTPSGALDLTTGIDAGAIADEPLHHARPSAASSDPDRHAVRAASIRVSARLKQNLHNSRAPVANRVVECRVTIVIDRVYINAALDQCPNMVLCTLCRPEH